jgi:ribosomal protein S10
MLNRRSKSRLRLISFGLDNEYIKSVYEEIFLMKYYAGWSFTELYNLPIVIRRWFLSRLVKQKETEKEEYEKASKK